MLLLRTGPLGLPVVFAPLPRLHVEAEGFAVRAPGALLEGRLPFPLGRATLLEPVLVCVPLRLPLAPGAALALQRAPLAGRESELGRRAGRLPVADVAGLRSREWAAGRLKCGRAAAGFPAGAAAGLRTAAGRGAIDSTGLGAAGAAGIAATIGASAAACNTTGSATTSSSSRECMKYAEAGIDELE
jgi:hypothetical protein